jgi:class 3 adenylate cyclase
MADDDKAFQDFLADLQSGSLTYDQVKKRYLELGDQIKDRYEREYTAISVDVVQSGRAKSSGNDLDAQLTFDAYHDWVDQKLKLHDCANASWAGDGLLAIFEQPDAAVATARALIDELPRFNNDSRRNRLPMPLQIRIGVHTGPILPGESEGLGKIASRTFDLAGHLQKSAAPNKILISETTYALIREGAGQFMPAHVELPNPSACFVYPPDIGPPGVYAPPPPTPTPQLPMTAPRPLVWPWVLGVAVLLGSAAVTVAVLNRGKPAAGPGAQPGLGQRPISVGNGAPAPAPGGNSQAPPAAGNPAPAPAPVAAGGGAAPPAPSAWEPSRVLWRSPAAEKGLPPTFTAATAERKWVLALGIGRYQDRGLAAEGAGNDAALVAAALQQATGVAGDHVRVVADERATRDGIKQAFQWLQGAAASGEDTVFVYIAGAAAIVPGQGGPAYALAAHDTAAQDVGNTGIRGADLAQWLGAVRAQTVVLLVDTPYAGGLEVPGQADPGRRLGLLAAASPVQRAPTSRGSQGGHYAEAVVAGLQGAADGNRDRRVTVPELQAYLAAEVPRRTGGALTPTSRAGFQGYLPDVPFGG